MRREHLTIYLLLVTAQLSGTHVSLIYLVDEFFIFSLLVLLKQMRTPGESIISSCCFCVWCKSRELGDRGSRRIPCVTPAVESFFSDLLRTIISYWVELHLESYETFTMELYCKNNQRLKHVDYFRKEKLHRSFSTALRMWGFKIKFHKIIRFRIITKFTVNRLYRFDYNETPP